MSAERLEPATLVFHREPTGWLLLAHAAIVAGNILLVVLGVVVLVASGLAATIDRELAGVVGRAPLRLTALLMVVSPFFTVWVLACWRRQRYGRCELVGDLARFEYGTDQSFEVSLVAVEERVATAHGVIVRVPGRPIWLDLVRPLLVPAPSEEERRFALRSLEPPVGAAAPAGYGPPRWVASVVGKLATAVALILTIVPVVLHIASTREPHVFMGVLAGLVLVGPAFWLSWVHWVAPRALRLHVGSAALLIGPARVRYGELVAVGHEDGLLALELGSAWRESEAPRRRYLFALGPAAAEAAAQVAARAELPLAGALPEWARASARRRALALLVVGVAAHFAWPPLFD